MWAPADSSALPTPQDLAHAKEVILEAENLHKDAVARLADAVFHAMMEKYVVQDGALIDSARRELSDNQSTLRPPDTCNQNDNIKDGETNPEAPLSVHQAQCEVEMLWRDLQARKAWIAPVRMLGYDVLSLIFEFCGEDDWKTTSQIAAVSRCWRNAVLATPRAWVFLDLKKAPREHMVQLYFHRSGQRPLHLYLPSSMSFISLSGVIQRIRCLNVRASAFSMECPCFSNVERLVIRGLSGQIRLSDLSTDHFPVLRCLVCDVNIINPSVPSSEAVLPVVAPLHTLSLVTSDDPTWFDVLRGCQSSLVTLKIDLDVPLIPSSILLPKLKCLEIQNWSGEPATGHSELITPVLETYVEHSDYMWGSSFHLDLGAVQRMRVDQVPTLSAIPKLKLLELELMQHFSDVMRQLLSDDSCCPDLEIIRWTPEIARVEEPLASEVFGPDVIHDIGKLNQKRNKPIHLSLATSKTRNDGLPGMIKVSACGANMPCSEYFR